MISWYAEYRGKVKPIAELASPELLAMMEPVQSFLTAKLASMAETDDKLDVVLEWSTKGIVGMSLSGSEEAVAKATSLLGDRASFLPFQA